MSSAAGPFYFVWQEKLFGWTNEKFRIGAAPLAPAGEKKSPPYTANLSVLPRPQCLALPICAGIYSRASRAASTEVLQETSISPLISLKKQPAGAIW